MRIELPDEPNTLARIATALGGLGANILHIDVHELDGTDVVDEILIAGPPTLSPGQVRSALLEAGARTVISVPIVHRQMDALVRALSALLTFVHDPSDQRLIAAVPSIVTVDAAGIERIDDLGDVDPSGRQLRSGTPAARATEAGWVLAVPRLERTPIPYDALVLRRGPRFSATEVARLRALLLLHAHLEAAGEPVR